MRRIITLGAILAIAPMGTAMAVGAVGCCSAGVGGDHEWNANASRSTEENRRTVEPARGAVTDQQGAGEPSADGSEPIFISGVQPIGEPPPDPPK